MCCRLAGGSVRSSKGSRETAGEPPRGARMQTLDFEVEIGPGAGQRYPVTARAPGGDAATSMHLPLTLEELDHQLAVINEAVLASSAVARRGATGDEQPVQQLGRRLFDALVTDDIHALYVTSV